MSSTTTRRSKKKHVSRLEFKQKGNSHSHEGKLRARKIRVDEKNKEMRRRCAQGKKGPRRAVGTKFSLGSGERKINKFSLGENGLEKARFGQERIMDRPGGDRSRKKIIREPPSRGNHKKNKTLQKG